GENSPDRGARSGGERRADRRADGLHDPARRSVSPQVAQGRHRHLGQSLLLSQGGGRLSARGRPDPLARLDQGARRRIRRSGVTIVARMVTLEQDGIPGYVAHPEGPGKRPGVLMVHHAHGVTADYKIDAYRLAQLGYNVLVPNLFNMFGVL